MARALLPHHEYVASLARKRMAVAALIRDTDDRALLVSPTYQDHWLVPGGGGDADEAAAVVTFGIAEATVHLHGSHGKDHWACDVQAAEQVLAAIPRRGHAQLWRSTVTRVS